MPTWARSWAMHAAAAPVAAQVAVSPIRCAPAWTPWLNAAAVAASTAAAMVAAAVVAASAAVAVAAPRAAATVADLHHGSLACPAASRGIRQQKWAASLRGCSPFHMAQIAHSADSAPQACMAIIPIALRPAAIEGRALFPDFKDSPDWFLKATP